MNACEWRTSICCTRFTAALWSSCWPERLQSLRRDAQRQPHHGASVGRTGDAEYGADEVCLLSKADQSKVAGLGRGSFKTHAVVLDLQLQLSGIAAAQRDADLRGCRVPLDIAQRLLGHAKDDFRAFIAEAGGGAIRSEFDIKAGMILETLDGLGERGPEADVANRVCPHLRDGGARLAQTRMRH